MPRVTENRIPVGAKKIWMFSDVPSGWLRVNGQTIGNAASGATGRANADTRHLFRKYWNDYDNTALPIQDSTGAASTRGASADDDFDANKRLPIYDPQGLYPRIIGSQSLNGRAKAGPTVLGEKQEDQMQRITGSTFPYIVQTNVAASNTGALTAGSATNNIADLSGGTTIGRRSVDLNSANSPNARASATTDGETRVSGFGCYLIVKL
jgi:hypothetical protein